MLAHDKNIKWRALFFSGLIFVLLFIGCWDVINHYERSLKQQQKLTLEKHLYANASSLSQVINHRFSLLYGVRAFILSNLDQFDKQGAHSDPAAVNLFLQELYRSIPDIRNVTIAPDGIHRYVYPATEQTKMLDHNLLADKRPHVQIKIRETIANKQIGLSGPYPLRQDNSLGLIARLPVYQNEKFWGFATMVLNVSKMLGIAGVDSDDFSLRMTGGDIFYGNADTFKQHAATTKISLPEGQWEMGLPLNTVGLTVNTRTSLLLFSAAFALLACLLFFFLYSRRWYLQLNIEEATKELHEQGTNLRESEALLRRTQEIAHLGSWQFNLSNNQLVWSDEVYRIFGLSPQEIEPTYENYLELVHPDDREMVDRAFIQSVETGREGYEVEHRIVRRNDKEVRIVHERCAHMRDEFGAVTKSIGMIQDISQQKQTEEELVRYQLHLETLVKEQTRELEDKVKDLERMNKIFVDREFRVKELRDKVKELEGL